MFIFPQAGTYEIFVRPVTPCGLGNETTKTITISSDCQGSFNRMVIKPNPVDKDLYIDLNIDNNVKAEKNRALNLQLFDINDGRLVKNWKIVYQTKLNISVSDVKNGQYVLVVTDGKERVSKQVIVRH